MSHSTPGALHRGGVRTIAVFEGAKGLLVLAASFGALTLLHRDLREMAEHIVHTLGLNPSSRWPGIFLEAAQKAGPPRVGHCDDRCLRTVDPRETASASPYAREAYEELRAATQGAHALVTHPLAMAGPLLAQKAGIPWASTLLSPMSLFSALDAPDFSERPPNSSKSRQPDFVFLRGGVRAAPKTAQRKGCRWFRYGNRIADS